VKVNFLFKISTKKILIINEQNKSKINDFTEMKREIML